jgi:5'-deoxynucleotidase
MLGLHERVPGTVPAASHETAARPVHSTGASVTLSRATSSDDGASVSHLFAYFSRMKLIRRWGLMHNTYPENVQEHTLQVALTAHALALVRNRLYGGRVDPARVAVIALYHDTSEVLTGDLPSPIKYFNPEIRKAYAGVESSAAHTLLEMVPAPLRDDYREVLAAPAGDADERALVKAADKLCAYMKCLEETAAGNREFAKAEEALRESVERIDLPEVRYFLETFVPSVRLTLDELG